MAHWLGRRRQKIKIDTVVTFRRNFEQPSWGARGDMSLVAGAAGELS
jgi:hypothetical protein